MCFPLSPSLHVFHVNKCMIRYVNGVIGSENEHCIGVTSGCLVNTTCDYLHANYIHGQFGCLRFGMDQGIKRVKGV